MYEMSKPDTVDPIQPIRRLAAGIVEIAINDIVGCTTALNGGDYKNLASVQGKFRTDALNWINNDRSMDSFGSFLWCCDVLSLDPEAVRTRINSNNFKKIQRSARVRQYSQEDYNARKRHIYHARKRADADRMRATH